jgi:hypothetical protein
VTANSGQRNMKQISVDLVRSGLCCVTTLETFDVVGLPYDKANGSQERPRPKMLN